MLEELAAAGAGLLAGAFLGWKWALRVGSVPVRAPEWQLTPPEQQELLRVLAQPSPVGPGYVIESAWGEVRYRGDDAVLAKAAWNALGSSGWTFYHHGRVRGQK
jgi:hypothetical protein